MEIGVKSLVLWIVIAILAIVTVYVLFFSGSSSSVVTAGETVGQVASSGMVGGC